MHEGAEIIISCSVNPGDLTRRRSLAVQLLRVGGWVGWGDGVEGVGWGAPLAAV